MSAFQAIVLLTNTRLREIEPRGVQLIKLIWSLYSSTNIDVLISITNPVIELPMSGGIGMAYMSAIGIITLGIPLVT